MPLISPALIAALLFLPACAAATTDVVTLKNRRELFVDDFLVHEISHLESRLGTPLRVGTAVKLDQPWEGRWGAYVSVISDGRKFQMYYRGGFGAKENKDLTWYAASQDGMTWERP